MKTAFIIYFRAVGLYAIFTLPFLALPYMYLISLWYVLLYGWFAWFVFSILYLVIIRFLYDPFLRFSSLFIAVTVSVACAFQVLDMIEDWGDIWHSGYIIFPFTAVLTGWISVCISRERIRSSHNVWITGKTSERE